jgi:hypothetical protein
MELCLQCNMIGVTTTGLSFSVLFRDSCGAQDNDNRNTLYTVSKAMKFGIKYTY